MDKLYRSCWDHIRETRYRRITLMGILSVVGWNFWMFQSQPQVHSKLSRMDSEQIFASELLNTTILRYVPRPTAGIAEVGIPLNVSRDQMTSLGIPGTQFIDMDQEVVKDFVFVTGVSENHFSESLDAIGSVQKYMSEYKILYYDLGLSKEQIAQIRTFCHVTYRHFDFESYPEHVKNLKTYAFKPLILQEVLGQYSGAVWMDASLRLFGRMDIIYPQVIKTGGFLQFWHSPHSNYAVTNPKMYQYLPTDRERQKTVWQRGAAAIVFFKTKKIYFNIFLWWVLCALDPDCIAPTGSDLRCAFVNDIRDTVYVGCHRFDQSALNILSSNLYNYDTEQYTSHNRTLVKLEKHVTHSHQVQTC